VHAAIESAPANQKLEPLREAPRAVRPRVEQPDFNERMGVELQNLTSGAGDAEVVEQQPNLDAAVRRIDQTPGQQVSRRILLPDEVLHVERLDRFVRQREARGQRELIAVE
jgi:hypothetical protein